MSAAEIIAYVFDNHEWCDQSHRCEGCRRTMACYDTPDRPKCEGCQMRDEAAAWLKEHAS